MTWLVLTHSHFSSIPSCRIPLSPLGVGWALWPTASGQLNRSRNVTAKLREWKAQWGSDSPNLSFSGISRTAEAKCSSRCSYVHEWSLSTVVPGWGGRVDRDPAVLAWDTHRHVESLWAFWKLSLQPELAYQDYRGAPLVSLLLVPSYKGGKRSPKSPQDLPEITQQERS